ncbi:molybdopterin-dependent oxidoreductase [Rudaea sp.]|uniref:nitrate reductase n=1 Tax=Rudaea sp. TaxID=2136325 RepID=UPI002ED16320
MNASLQASPKLAARTTRSTCCYCGVGCGVLIETALDANGAGTIVGVQGDPEHPANFGRLCSKGSTLHLTASPALRDQARALHPELRRARAQPRVRASWSEALDFVAERFAAIVREHGPDAVAFYISGQLLTEDYYVFNKLAKGLVGTNNIDTNSRLCMSSAVAGYKQTLGADAPPCSYEDLDHAKCVFIAGANPAFAHPILFRRLEDAKTRNPDLRIVVADPRRTDSAESADLHLRLTPGSDVVLFLGMLHVLIAEGLIDEAWIAAHTEGFDATRELALAYSPERASGICGVPVDDLVTAARWFAAGPTLSLYCQGLNQSTSGTAKNAALIHLHLATAQIGKPGAGPFSLTGQPNAMGGREVGGMANLLSAHRDLANAGHRAEVAQLWGIDNVPATPGKTAVEIFDAIERGEIRALWIACTNPAQSLPDQRAVRRALERCEFVVLQDAYAHTATAPYADVLLPASSWGEKEGTVTNSERRISRVRAASAPPGEARADWRIARDVALRIEARLRPGKTSLFDYATPESIWNEHRETTRGRDLDISGLSYAMLERDGPQQWPYRTGDVVGTARLYTNGHFATPNGRARFATIEARAPAETTDWHYPLALTTGRLRDQWHGMSRTGTLPQAFDHAGEPAIEIHPADAARIGVETGDFVHITSRRASIVLPVHTSDAQAPGQTFVAMHWGEEFVSGLPTTAVSHGINALLPRAFDPVSKQPELKHAAIAVRKADLPWQWVACAEFAPERWFETQTLLRRYFARFPYTSCVPFGRERPGLLWRVAAHDPCSAELRQEIEALFGLGAGEAVLSYNDVRRASGRRLRLAGDRLVAFSLAGDVAAAGWLREYLESGIAISTLGRLLLLPSRTPPSVFSKIRLASKGRTICTCIGVRENDIVEKVQKSTKSGVDALLAELKASLRCGSGCGSCVPELKRLIATNARTAQAVPA